MKNTTADIAKVLSSIENQLNQELFIKDGQVEEKKLWQNTYIKKQIDKKKERYSFSLKDHIRAMTYSMLSAGIPWDKVANDIDLRTGQIHSIDKIFFDYEASMLLQSTPESLRDNLKKIHCASQYTLKQMKALIDVNIKKLISIEKEYGNIDIFYEQISNGDKTYKTLIHMLADSKSEYKLVQMGDALVAEYLRNVGYDISKPDRHIQRILGSKILGLSENEIVPVDECFDIVSALADIANKSVAEVDYILWSYCAKGYGEICTAANPKCNKCRINSFCNMTLQKEAK